MEGPGQDTPKMSPGQMLLVAFDGMFTQLENAFAQLTDKVVLIPYKNGQVNWLCVWTAVNIRMFLSDFMIPLFTFAQNLIIWQTFRGGLGHS